MTLFVRGRHPAERAFRGCRCGENASGLEDRTVNVGFGGKVHDRIDAVARWRRRRPWRRRCCPARNGNAGRPRRSRRFAGFPAYVIASRLTSCRPGCRRRAARTKFDPIKPSPPVTSHRIVRASVTAQTLHAAGASRADRPSRRPGRKGRAIIARLPRHLVRAAKLHSARMPGDDGSRRDRKARKARGREPERTHLVRRYDARPARSGRPLRPPDPPLEPEDEAVHLPRAQRHLHHRSRTRPCEAARDAYDVVKQTVAASGEVDPLRRHQEAGAGRRSRKRPSAAGTFYVNQRWLGGTLTNFATIQKRIERLRELERMKAQGDFDRLPKKEVAQPDRRDGASWSDSWAASRTCTACPTRSSSSTRRRSASRSARRASWGSRSSRSSIRTAIRTKSTTRSRATTTRSARSN